MKKDVWSLALLITLMGCNGDDLDQKNEFTVDDLTFEMTHSYYSDFGYSDFSSAYIRRFWFYDGPLNFLIDTAECPDCQYYVFIETFTADKQDFEDGVYQSVDFKSGFNRAVGVNYAQVSFHEFIPPVGDLVAGPQKRFVGGSGTVKIQSFGNEKTVTLNLDMYRMTQTFPAMAGEKVRASGRFNGVIVDTSFLDD